MKKSAVLAFFGLSIVSLPIKASEHVDNTLFERNVVMFSDNSSADTENEYPTNISLVKQEKHKVTLDANLHSLTFAKTTLADGITYDRILLPGGAGKRTPGNPNIESYSKMLPFPGGAEIQLVIDDITWSKPYNDITIDPAQLPFPDVALRNGERPDENMPFVKNANAYNSLSETKHNAVEISNTLRVRGKNYAVIKYQPIDFNPINRSVRFATHVRFHINYNNETSNSAAQQKSAPKNESFTAAQLADYLIITPSDFTDAITPLADWKREMGYNVYVAKTTETGSSQEEIKAYIKNAYLKGTMTSYALLVGDNENLPGWEIVGHPYHGQNHKWRTDFIYSLVDGDDDYADLAIGRLPGDTKEEISLMVNRTLKYQKAPESNDRYNHVLLAGQFQDADNDLEADRMFMEDLHRVADFLGADYDFFSQPGDLFNKGFQVHTALQWDSATAEELKYSGWNYGRERITPPELVPPAWKNQGEGNHTDITRIINEGVGFVMHRDHGYGGGSGWVDPHFTDTEVDNLTNNTITPVVFSLNCATGWFDGIDSFAESWMLNPIGGAVGFTGAARVSYSGYNDLFHVGIMDTFWEDYTSNWTSDIYPTSWKPAVALNRAKQMLFDEYSAQDETAKLTARLFNWFGDPDLELRTSTPEQLYAFHPASLKAGTSEPFEVAVRTRPSATEGARVALLFKDGSSLVGETDNSGRVTFNFEAKESFKITITEHNGIPYQADVDVIAKPTKPVIPTTPVIAANQAKPTSTLITDDEKSAGAFSWVFLMFTFSIGTWRFYEDKK